jgi:hypothetical protein
MQVDYYSDNGGSGVAARVCMMEQIFWGTLYLTVIMYVVCDVGVPACIYCIKPTGIFFLDV